MIDEMLKETDAGLISVYYGSDVKAEDQEALEKLLNEKYTDYDIELQFGGQPVYYYIVSVE